MTDMKRITVSLTDEIVEQISRLRQTEAFAGCSYAEIIRRLVIAGLPSPRRK